MADMKKCPITQEHCKYYEPQKRTCIYADISVKHLEMCGILYTKKALENLKKQINQKQEGEIQCLIFP